MKAKLPEPQIVTRNGKPVSVILPIKDYQEIMERLENAEDVAYLKKARRTPLHYRPLDEVIAELKKE
jgi:mRNA interferase RelE/StbE